MSIHVFKCLSMKVSALAPASTTNTKSQINNLSRNKHCPKFEAMNEALLVVSDGNGNIFEIPDFYMCGMNGTTTNPVDKKDLIELPYGSDLFELPGRFAIGFDPRKKELVEVREYQGNRVYPVAAFMAPAHLQILRTAYKKEPDCPRLPLYNYTAVGWWNEP